MIKDVKSYLQTVTSRILNAFRRKSFGTEDELEFWALSAEYLSQKALPSFVDITGWIDRLYHAPVHFIYKNAKNGKLTLFKRHIIADNIIRDLGEEFYEISSQHRNKVLSKLEEQLQNLEHEISFSEDFMSVGMSSFSIGRCEHIPLFKEGAFWGIYCLGPYIKSPEAMVSKFSIISRILTLWLVALEDKDEDNQLDQDRLSVEKNKESGSGELNIAEVSDLLIRHVVESSEAFFGSVISRQNKKLRVLANYYDPGFSDNPVSNLSAPELLDENSSSFTLSESALEIFEQAGLENFQLIPIDEQACMLLLYKDAHAKDLNTADDNLQYFIGTQKALLTYQKQRKRISGRLIETYYRMQRTYEKNQVKTMWHTPRMIAFTDKFSEIFDLDENEKTNLHLTARLHDIGYAGSLHIDKKMSVGADIEHPLVGEMMIKQLPVPRVVKEGIRTHHEWVNGSGTPKQVKEEEIPWTGKIIGVFEFIVEFIENHHLDDSKTDGEWLEQLIEALIDRADQQFDMVLIPTFVELLKSLGWKKCCELGVE